MQKTSLKIVLGLLLPAALAGVLWAQSGTAKLSVGKVDLTFDAATYNPELLHLMGHAKMTSENYDLYAADIKAYTLPGSKSGASGLQQAIAEGGAVPGTQVIAHIRQPLQSEEFDAYSDRAVYTPDATRPSGGAIKFTGHVKVISKSGFLAEPSLSTFETATVLLGAGPDYPKIDTGAGHITLTPAQ